MVNTGSIDQYEENTNEDRYEDEYYAHTVAMDNSSYCRLCGQPECHYRICEYPTPMSTEDRPELSFWKIAKIPGAAVREAFLRVAETTGSLNGRSADFLKHFRMEVADKVEKLRIQSVNSTARWKEEKGQDVRQDQRYNNSNPTSNYGRGGNNNRYQGRGDQGRGDRNNHYSPNYNNIPPNTNQQGSFKEPGTPIITSAHQNQADFIPNKE